MTDVFLGVSESIGSVIFLEEELIARNVLRDADWRQGKFI